MPQNKHTHPPVFSVTLITALLLFSLCLAGCMDKGYEKNEATKAVSLLLSNKDEITEWASGPVYNGVGVKADMAYFWVRDDGKIFSINEFAQQLTGAPLERFIGSKTIDAAIAGQPVAMPQTLGITYEEVSRAIKKDHRYGYYKEQFTDANTLTYSRGKEDSITLYVVAGMIERIEIIGSAAYLIYNINFPLKNQKVIQFEDIMREVERSRFFRKPPPEYLARFAFDNNIKIDVSQRGYNDLYSIYAKPQMADGTSDRQQQMSIDEQIERIKNAMHENEKLLEANNASTDTAIDILKQYKSEIKEAAKNISTQAPATPEQITKLKKSMLDLYLASSGSSPIEVGRSNYESVMRNCKDPSLGLQAIAVLQDVAMQNGYDVEKIRHNVKIVADVITTAGAIAGPSGAQLADAVLRCARGDSLTNEEMFETIIEGSMDAAIAQLKVAGLATKGLDLTKDVMDHSTAVLEEIIKWNNGEKG